MRLRRFVLDGFAQLDHVDVDFRDDAPNVVLGANEAGKSHLMQALFGMFFGVEHPERLLPWYGPQTMTGVLDFVDGDGRPVRLERDLTGKDVTVTVGDEKPWSGKIRGSTADARRFGACLESWFGFRDEGLFTAMTFVRQSDIVLRVPKDARLTLASHIKELITGADGTDYDKVLTALTDQLDTLRRGPGKHKDRRIELAEAELAALRQRYSEAVAEHDAWASINHELSEVRQTLATTRADETQLHAQLDRVRCVTEIEKEKSSLDQEFQRLQARRVQLDEFGRDLSRAQSERQALAAFATVDEAALLRAESRVGQAERDVQRLEPRVNAARAAERLDAPVQEAERAVNALPVWPAGLTLTSILDAEAECSQSESAPVQAGTEGGSGARPRWTVVGILALAGLVGGVMVHPLLLLLVLAAAAYAGLPYIRRGTPNNDAIAARVAHEQAESRLHVLLQRAGVLSVAEARTAWQRREEALQRLEQAQVALDAALHEAEVASVTQAQTLVTNYERALQARDADTRALRRMLHDLSVDSVQEARAHLKACQAADGAVQLAEGRIQALGDAAEIQASWEAAGTARAAKTFELKHLLQQDVELAALLTSEDRAAYCGQLQQQSIDLARTIETLTDLETDLRGKRADLGRTALPDAPALWNEIQQREPELARLKQQAGALECAIGELSRTVAQFRDDCLGGVVGDTAEFLGAITDGRYTQAHVESAALLPALSTEDRDGIPVEDLSRGVQDQLYFSLRVALARAITRGHTLPLVLDDPFVNFDPVRRERVLTLLRHLVDRSQVVLFTCDPWYAQQFTPVLELPASDVPRDLDRAAGVA